MDERVMYKIYHFMKQTE